VTANRTPDPATWPWRVLLIATHELGASLLRDLHRTQEPGSPPPSPCTLAGLETFAP